MQVDPIKPVLKPPKTKRLKVKVDEPLSSFAFKFNLRRYITDRDQHDSQEFMRMLIDSLNDELNRVTQPPPYKAGPAGSCVCRLCSPRRSPRLPSPFLARWMMLMRYARSLVCRHSFVALSVTP